ncbi:MAG: toxin-antitoxin system HicB family antitoxin [Actinomycetota bacterium]
MAQITVRADEDVVERVKAAAARSGRSMNEWVTRVLDVASNPQFEADEATRLRELLRDAGLLSEPTRPEPAPPVDEERLARARRAAGKGTPLSQLVADGRG